MPGTIAVLGAGPGLGRSVARRFGREGYRVALVARTPSRVDGLVAELRDEGIDVTGFAADLADREALPGLLDSVTARLGGLDVVEYAPSGPEWLDLQTGVLDAVPQSFEYPLDLLLRTPVTLARHVLPAMTSRGNGGLLFGLGAMGPYPPVANVGSAGSAARAYFQNLHIALAPSGVYVGLLQVAGLIGGSDAARRFVADHGAAGLPEPLDPGRLADAFWDMYAARSAFESVIGGAAG
jgi:NAD(P)-dependent dehydrogenase (short-subunit alcohol dehydrogenase family)